MGNFSLSVCVSFILLPASAAPNGRRESCMISVVWNGWRRRRGRRSHIIGGRRAFGAAAAVGEKIASFKTAAAAEASETRKKR